MARTVMPKSGVIRKVVSLKVTLRGTEPPVWRRLLVPGETALGDLHRAIQAAMGWEDDHLHTFDIEGKQYGDPRAVDDVADEKRVALNGLIKSGVARFAYTYDFGDNWEHALVIEKSPPDVEALSRPICTAGKRRCPPEDCGGPWGYRELLEVLADPAHPEHAERCESVYANKSLTAAGFVPRAGVRGWRSWQSRCAQQRGRARGHRRC